MMDHLISHLAVESRITFPQNFGKRLTPSLEVVTLVNSTKAVYSIYHTYKYSLSFSIIFNTKF